MSEATPRRSGKVEYEQVYQLFCFAGCDVTRFAQARRSRQTPGIPDLYVRHVELRKRLWFEVKSGSGRPTKPQRGWIETEQACDGDVVVGGYEDAVEVLIDWRLVRRFGNSIQLEPRGGRPES